MTADYTLRDGVYYRAGLSYEPDTVLASFVDEEEVFFYQPDGPFTVDGIRYERPHTDTFHVRPMIELFTDGMSRGYPYRHEPLTEAQLDEWVWRDSRGL